MMDTIRSLFSARRPIDRTIEKVIDYYAQAEDRLAAEIEEYEITDNIEACFRKFLDVFSTGVQGGRVTETCIWVSGFYGSGKSSFTKYLGFALDPARMVQGKPFLDLLCERFSRAEIPAALRTAARRHPTAVILLDLNDGVIINAAPPHRLFRYRQWAQETKACWEKLERGEYEWAHMAYTIWPQRVREVCRRDRSIAIAHGLEELYETPLPKAEKKEKRKSREVAAGS